MYFLSKAISLISSDLKSFQAISNEETLLLNINLGATLLLLLCFCRYFIMHEAERRYMISEELISKDFQEYLIPFEEVCSFIVHFEIL